MPRERGLRHVPCAVEFYAGSKIEETPRRVHCRGKVMDVDEVLGRRRVRDSETGETAEEFSIRIAGMTATLRRELSGQWTLLLPREVSE